jgi:hypothetical protein
MEVDQGDDLLSASSRLRDLFGIRFAYHKNSAYGQGTEHGNVPAGSVLARSMRKSVP